MFLLLVEVRHYVCQFLLQVTDSLVLLDKLRSLVIELSSLVFELFRKFLVLSLQLSGILSATISLKKANDIIVGARLIVVQKQKLWVVPV